VAERGNAIEYVHDGAGRLVAELRGQAVAAPAWPSCLDPGEPRERRLWTLDGAGQRTNEKLQRDEGGGGDLWVDHAETSWVYQGRCHLEKTIEAPGRPEEAVTEYAYDDCAGNLTAVWDPLHPRASHPSQPSTSYTYDELDRLVAVTQPWGGAGGGTVTTAYAYDVQDHLVRVTDGEGNETEYVYSDRDLLTREESPVSGVTAHTYTEHGELRETTDARGVTVTRAVDAAGRVTFVDYPGTALDRTYTWGTDPGTHTRGRLTAITNETTSIAYAYDAHGRLVQDGDLLFTHDANGNLATVTYPGGLVASYAHDAMDREQSLTVQPAGGTAVPVVAGTPGASYRPFGPLEGLTFGNGLAELRAHDFRYVPGSISLRQGASDLFAWEYMSDALGNLIEITETAPEVEWRKFAYQDWQYYLASASGPWCGEILWWYDRSGNRTMESRCMASFRNYRYQRNAAGGSSPILESVLAKGAPARFYGYDAAGNVSRIETIGEPLVALTTDAAGQLGATARGEYGLALSYDGRGFLRRAELRYEGEPTENTTTATYDSAGRLLALYRESGTYSTERTAYLYLGDRPVAQWQQDGGGSGNLTYLTVDHLGTPVAASNSVGTLVWSGGFTPFGEEFTRPSAGDHGIFLRLPGQWSDPFWYKPLFTTDLYYNVHRWYEAGTGRYVSPDYFGLLASPNLFVYVDGRPTFYIDPLGLQLVMPIAFPPPGCFCAVNIFWDTFREMRRANWRNSDRYFHCKANCEATRCGNGGESCACLLSNLREWFDQAKGDYPSDSWLDQGANQIGRYRSKTNPRNACSVNCNTFRPRNLPPEY
jgi:RHS repeat-associated protein